MLSLSQAIKISCKRHISITGRTSRSEYWWSISLLFTLSFILTSMHMCSYIDDLIVFVINCMIVALFIALTVRRLHDINRTGLYVLLSLLPFGLILIMLPCVIKGSTGRNRYGRDPLSKNYYDFYLKKELNPYLYFDEDQINQTFK